MIWHSDSTTDILASFGSTIHCGLSSAQVEWRMRELKHEQRFASGKAHCGRAFLRLLFSPSLIIAGLLCLFCCFLAVYNTTRGKPDDVLPSLLLFGSILLCAFLCALVQTNAHRKLKSLGKRGAPAVTVLRDEQRKVIPADELIPGDIVYIVAGDFIPADCRLLTSEWLVCNETAVSGESHVIKDATAVLLPITKLPERRNMIYAGSTVVSGAATAVAVEIGEHTEQQKLFPKHPFTQQPVLKAITPFYKIFTALFAGAAFVLTLIALLCGVELQSALLCGAALLAVTAKLLPSLLLTLWTQGLSKGEEKGICFQREDAVTLLSKADILAVDLPDLMRPEKIQLVVGFSGDRQIDFREDAPQSESAKTLLRLSALCVEKNPRSAEDRAILHRAEAYGMPTELLHEHFPAAAALPENHDTRLTLGIYLIGGQKVLVAKALPSFLLPRCAEADIAAEAAADFGKQGLHLLAVAYKYVDDVPTDLTSDDLLQNLRFAGLLGFSTPVSARTSSLVDNCCRSGVSVTILSGDSRETVLATTEQLQTENRAFASEQIYTDMNTAERSAVAESWKNSGHTAVICSSYSVSLLKAAGVPCTTEDAAPALKAVADVVLPDSRFATVYRSILLCRTLFERLSRTALIWYVFLTVLLAAAAGVLFGLLSLPLFTFAILPLAAYALPLLFTLFSNRR